MQTLTIDRSIAALAVILLVTLAPTLSAQEPADSIRRDSLPATELEPITVSVSRTDAPLRTLPFATATVNRDELQRGRATLGLDEALITVPGVLAANRYNYTQDLRISIRGFGARSAFGVRGVKILLDGIPQTLPDGQGQLSNVEPSELERIDVLRGSSSSLHGNASGGVISLVSTTRIPARIAPEARMTVGAFGTWKWTARADAPVGPGAVRVSASRTALDGYRDHARAEVWHVQLRAVEPLSARTQLTFLGYLTDVPLAKNPGALTAEQVAESPNQADPRNVTVDANESTTQALGGIAVAHTLPGNGSIDVVVHGAYRDVENVLSFASIDLERRVYGTRASVTLPRIRRPVSMGVTAGVDTQWQRDKRLNFSPDGTDLDLYQVERVWELGPFVQTRIGIGESVSFTGGLRYDRVAFAVDDRFVVDGDASGDEVMDAVSWSAGFTFAAHETFVPYVSVASAFETPTTTELVNRPEGGGGLNPAIDPQSAINYEVGVRGRVAGIMDYSVAGFYADVEDELIPFEVPSEPGRRFFRNAGSSRHAGVEAGLTVRPYEGLAILGAYTFADYEFTEFQTEDDTFDGNEIPGVPRHQLHWSVRYLTANGLWGAVDNTHTSSLVVNDANTTEAEGWWTTNLRVGWDGQAGRVRIAPFVGVLNAFDERYSGSVVVNARGGRYFEPAPGRNVYVGLEVGALR
jgi:iron complex outermembrane receptor protein